jgi:hypothetical protein
LKLKDWIKFLQHVIELRKIDLSELIPDLKELLLNVESDAKGGEVYPEHVRITSNGVRLKDIEDEIEYRKQALSDLINYLSKPKKV